MTGNDIGYMSAALEKARGAGTAGDVPVGCVIVRDGSIIASAGNSREQERVATAHAECRAIEQACRTLGGWHLTRCTLYVTLEPCPMCAGAIANARIDRVVYGASDPKSGAYGSLFDLNAFPINHRPETVGGVLAEECAALLREFFAARRSKKSHAGTPVAADNNA